MKIALVSLNQIWEDKAANQRNCTFFIEKAAELETDLIVFPEMTLTGFSMDTKLIAENPLNSQSIDFFIKQAKDRNISIAFGVVLSDGNKATNNMIIIDKSGELLVSYSKIHPFSFSGESNYYVGGNKVCFCNISGVNIGLSVCYDLRYPEIFQFMSKSCDIIITIANWPEKRINHWTVLLQARAIENQCYMVGVNRTGIDGNKLSYVKSSSVFDPAGVELQPMEAHKEMDIYIIHPENIPLIRESFPIKHDRKNDFYKTLL